MRIMAGFISNSSGTSFIVALRKNAKGTITIPVSISLVDDLGAMEFGTKEQLLDYFNDVHGENWASFPSVVRRFNECLLALLNGMVVYSGIASYSDGPPSEMVFSQLSASELGRLGVQVILKG